MRVTSWPLASPMAAPTERDQARDERLTRLARDHFDFIWRTLRRTGFSPADADDATQQVFMIATRKLDEISAGNERMFLYGTARRIAANARRSSRRRPEVEGDVDAVATPERGPEALTELSKAVSLLDQLLERLPPELARVLVLAEIEELEVSEIAKLEELKLGTAASRLRRARHAFKLALDELGEQNPFTGGER